MGSGTSTRKGEPVLDSQEPSEQIGPALSHSMTAEGFRGASVGWAAEAKAALEALPEGESVEARFECEFSEDLAPALHGTTLYIPHGLTRSMEDEFRQNDGGEWMAEYNYVVLEPAEEKMLRAWERAPLHTRDKGHGGMSLVDFAASPGARTANLTQAEVAAVRLYTSRWFLNVNAVLRAGSSSAVEAWGTSISVLISAIIKISQLNAGDVVVYRQIPCRFPAALALSSSPPRASNTFLERGFVSCSTDAAYTAEYSGAKQHECVFLIIEPSWASRPAHIAFLSQFPEQDEFIFPPFTALRFLESELVGCKLLVRCQAQVCTMRHFTEGLRFPWSSPSDPLSHAEYDEIEAATREWGETIEAVPPRQQQQQQQGKYASHARELITGAPKTAALGLEDFMQCSMAEAMQQHAGRFEAVVSEMQTHGTAEDNAWLDYVLNQGTSEKEVCGIGTRDRGRPTGMTLSDFVASPEAQRAKLQREHVLALRLYTTPCYVSLNAPLRSFVRDAEGNVVVPVTMAAPHPFPVTILLIAEAIKRLRDTTGDKDVTLWRGVKNVTVATDFLRGGGVEMAPMSTSYALSTALHYSRSAHSVIFRVVTRNFMERGASVEFLSAFPRERECLFPPLTFLSPTGRTQRVGPAVTVVEVTPRL